LQRRLQIVIVLLESLEILLKVAKSKIVKLNQIVSVLCFDVGFLNLLLIVAYLVGAVEKEEFAFS